MCVINNNKSRLPYKNKLFIVCLHMCNHSTQLNLIQFHSINDSLKRMQSQIINEIKNKINKQFKYEWRNAWMHAWMNEWMYNIWSLSINTLYLYVYAYMCVLGWPLTKKKEKNKSVTQVFMCHCNWPLCVFPIFLCVMTSAHAMAV